MNIKCDNYVIKRDLWFSRESTFALCWQCGDGPPACRELSRQMEAMFKVCGTTGVWVPLARAVVGPSAIRGEEQNYKLQRPEAKTSVESSKVSTPATVCALHSDLETIYYQNMDIFSYHNNRIMNESLKGGLIRGTEI